MKPLLIPLLLALVALPVAHVQAQGSAGKRKAAAEAYDRGTADYLAGDYARAAEWFETAHRMAPAAPALMQAIRAHKKADNRADAASLALRLKQDYGDVSQAVAYADQTLEELAPELHRVDVVCDECKVDLDGRIIESTSFFIEPGSDHEVTGSFRTGDVGESVRGAAGETSELRFDAPPPPVEPQRPEPPPGPPDRLQVDTEGGKLSPLYTYVAAGITGALAVGAVFTYISLGDKNEAYEQAAAAYDGMSQDLYQDAKDKQDAALKAETLSNVMLISTGVAAVGTGVIAYFFTDWGGDDEAGLTFRLERVQDGPFVSLGGRF